MHAHARAHQWDIVGQARRGLRGVGAVLTTLALSLTLATGATAGRAGQPPELPDPGERVACEKDDPVLADPVLEGLAQVATGGYHSVALTTDGRVYTWGRNNFGQLGDGTTTDAAAPTQVDTSGVLDGVTISYVATGHNYTLAIDSEGRAYGWGANTDGQLGDGTRTRSSVPVAVDTSGVLAGVRLASIDGGTYHSVALSDDGRAYAWGFGSVRLGSGTFPDIGVPVAVDASEVLKDVELTQVSASGGYTVVLGSNGFAYAWGSGYYGEFGDGGATPSAPTPIRIGTTGAVSDMTFTHVSTGSYHTVLLGSDERVYTTGDNGFGQLGDGTKKGRSTFAPVDTAGALDGVDVLRVAAVSYSTVVLGGDSRTYAWGLGHCGEDGNAPALSPTRTGHDHEGTDVVLTDVSSGPWHVVTLAADGRAYAWGDHQGGQARRDSLPVRGR